VHVARARARLIIGHIFLSPRCMRVQRHRAAVVV
jgi:hypothetical protein